MEKCPDEPGSSSACSDEADKKVFALFEDSDGEEYISDQLEVSSISNEKTGWIDKIKKAGSVFSSIRPTASKENLKKRFWSTWNNFKYSGKWMSDRTSEYDEGSEIVLLGSSYSPEASGREEGFANFVLHYYSRIWVTYRTHMEALCNTNYTTDCGWGCMIRTTQMMVAQSIIINHLGRDWRSNSLREKLGLDVLEALGEHDEEIHLQIIRLFEDTPTASLGFHKMMSFAYDDIGAKAIGRWYSPSESISLMRKAIITSTSPLVSDLAILLCVDGLLKLSDVEILSRAWTKSLLIIITVRLGTTEPNMIYLKHVQHILKLTTCVGIVGGKPEHSLYFIGFHKEQLIYLDPHVARDYVPLPESLKSWRDVSESSYNNSKHNPLHLYHCKYMSMTPYAHIDPSCAVGLLIQNHKQFMETVATLEACNTIDVDDGTPSRSSRTSDPLFAVLLSDNPSFSLNKSAPTEDEKQTANEHGFEIL